MNVDAASVVWLRSIATYIFFMNSSLAAVIDALIRTLAGNFQMKRGASRSREMLRLRRYLGFGGNVHVDRSHVLIVQKVKKDKITLNSSPLDSFGSSGWGGNGIQIFIPGFFSGISGTRAFILGFLGVGVVYGFLFLGVAESYLRKRRRSWTTLSCRMILRR